MVLQPLQPLSGQRASCAHCGLPAVERFASEAGAFCCAGCRTAYGMLSDHNLLGYYDLRSRFGGESAPVDEPDRPFVEFDDPDTIASFSTPTPDGWQQSRLLVPEIHCAACLWVIERLLLREPGVRDAAVDLASGAVELTWNPREVRLSELVRMLALVGYSSHPAVEDAAASLRRRADRALWLRVGISGALAGNLMLLSVPLYTGNWWGIDPRYAALFRWVSAVMATVVVFYGAAPFHRSAWGGLRAGVLHIDTPISLGVLVAWGGSMVATVRQHDDVFFDSIGGLVFFLLVGRLVLRHGQRRAETAVQTLLGVGDRTARLLRGDGSLVHVLSARLRPGDVIHIPAGAVLPVDGIIESGETRFNNAVVTGESAPAQAGPGDTVVAGAINLGAAVDVRATEVGATRRIARIASLLGGAAAERAPVVELANRVAGWFTIATITASFSTAIVWLLLDPARALPAAVAVAVVMCPCALGLATPLALAVAQGRASRAGIMVKGGDAIQRAAEVQTVLFDKTGTLTCGTPAVIGHVGQATFGDRPLADLLAAVEQHSLHPVGTALATHGNPTGFAVGDIVETPGSGISALVDGVRVRIGSRRWLGEGDTERWSRSHEDARAGSRISVELDGRVVAALAVGDPLRTDTVDAVARLHQSGLETVILSGDEQRVADAVGVACGIGEVLAEQTPESKLEEVVLRRRQQRVAMVGDGINDAASLAAAHLGVAVSGAADAALETADVYFAGQGTMQLVELLAIARRAMAAIRRNTGISLAYNTVGLVLAASGTIGPLGAALLMPVSSLSVVLSSMWQGRDSAAAAVS